MRTLYDINAEAAQNIVSAWLHDEHLEDIGLIPTGEFPEELRGIVSELKAGADVGDLAVKHRQTITELSTRYSEALYARDVQQILKAEMIRTFPPNASPEQAIKHAEKFRRYWVDRPQPVDLITVYSETLARRARQKPIHTGIALYDDLTGGICKGRLTIVGARPSTGKSAFTLQVAVDVASKGAKVLFLPLEMSAQETVDRIIARFSKNTTAMDLQRGELSREKWQDVSDILETKIYALRDNFKVYDRARELDVIRGIVETERPDLIVIDQLSQIRTAEEYKTIREQYVEITRTLKAMALEFDTAVWLPCQMNREASKGGTYSIDYIKESGSIEEDADEVLILSRVKDDKSESGFKADSGGQYIRLELAKNRMGRCGEDELQFNGARFRFRNVAKDMPAGFVETQEEIQF